MLVSASVDTGHKLELWVELIDGSLKKRDGPKHMLSANACIEAWLRGRSISILWTFIGTWSVLTLSCPSCLCLPLSSIFAIPIGNHDTRYILWMKSRGKGTDSPLSKKNVKPLLKTGFTNTEGAPTVCTSPLLQVFGHRMRPPVPTLCRPQCAKEDNQFHFGNQGGFWHKPWMKFWQTEGRQNEQISKGPEVVLGVMVLWSSSAAMSTGAKSTSLHLAQLKYLFLGFRSYHLSVVS